MSFKLDIITSEEQFVLMRQAWDGIVLSNAEQHTIFQSWAYIFNHWKFRKSGDGFSRTLRLYALYDDASLIAVAPMWINIIRKGLSFRVMEFIGNRGIDYLDFIVKSGTDRQKAVTYLIDCILADNCWDVVSFSELREQSANVLTTVLSDHGVAHDLDKCSTCVSIPLPMTWAEYRTQIGKSTRRHLNYEERRLEKLHKTEFIVNKIFTPKFAEELNTLHAAHQKRWNAVGQKGVFHTENDQLMDVEVCKALAEIWALRYFVLSVDGVPEAGMACAALGKTMYVHYMLIALESNLRNLSMGKVILQKVIKWGIENGYSILDLLRGQEPYKFNFGGKAVPNYRITICRNTLVKLTVWLARLLGKPI